MANQEYRACIRQEVGMCSIAYEPCSDQSFRIGQRPPPMQSDTGTQAADAPVSNPSAATQPAMVALQDPAVMPANPAEAAAIAPASDQVAAPSADDPEVVEGSGGGDGIVADAPIADVPASGFFSLPSFPSIFPSFLTRGLFGASQLASESRRSSKQLFNSACTDRITLPCVVEDFIAAGMGNVPNCFPVHCGNTLCPNGVLPCRVESTVTPFGLGVHFGDGQDKGSPEDNIGACLRYNQLNCLN